MICAVKTLSYYDSARGGEVKARDRAIRTRIYTDYSGELLFREKDPVLAAIICGLLACLAPNTPHQPLAASRAS